MPPTPVRVLVVDDQQPFRVAASAVLRRMPDFTLVGEAETGEDGVRAAAPRPRAHGRAPARHRRRRRGGSIHAETPTSIVVLCSSYAREDLSLRSMSPVWRATCTRWSC